MDRHTMIGQKLVTGLPGTVVTEEFTQLVKEYKVGNVILFARNIESPQQLKKLCSDLHALILKETGHPAFITIDQEGGNISRLGSPATVVPGAMELSATGNPQNAYEAGRITALELMACGVNFNLAPVMDINSNPLNPVIGARSFGDSPDTVSAFGVQMMKGLQSTGMPSCLKHFPGHGDTAVDSHLGLPSIDKNLDELCACELKPFAAAINEGVKAVMTTHILFPQIEPNNVPATMSKIILQDILRKKLHFNGLILSDCMMMDAIAQHYGTVEGTCAAAMAGVDMIFICHSNALTAKACEELSKIIPDDELFASYQRILNAKSQLPENQPDFSLVGCEEHLKCARTMVRSSVTFAGGPTEKLPHMGKNPLFVGCSPFQTTQAANPEEKTASLPVVLQKAMGGEAYSCSSAPDDAEIQLILSKAEGKTAVVLSTFNAHLCQEQKNLIAALARLDLPFVLVAMRNPYDLVGMKDQAWCLAAYDYTADSLEAVSDVLAGKLSPEGKMPVQL